MRIYSKKQFRSDLWKQAGEYRAQVIRLIIAQKLLIGKHKNEIKELCGIEDNYFDLDEWAYLVKKNIFGGKTYLLLNFNQSNQVIKVYKRTLYI